MRFLAYDNPDNPTAVVLRHLTTGRACCSGSDPRRFCPDCFDAVTRIVAPQPDRMAVVERRSTPAEHPDDPPSVADFLKNPRDPALPPVMPGRNTADDPPSVADVIREQFEKGVRI